MSLPDDRNRLTTHNSVVLANAINFTSLIARGILGKEVGTSVGGSPIKDEAVAGLLGAQIKSKVGF